ncbi:MAG TPA: family 43 glycosylhydrolase, partial [Polyangiaceae bacterium]
GRHGAVFQAEIELETGRLRDVARPIWNGTGGVWPEGPHLYKIGGRYYLLIAEGGTSYQHAVTIARSDSPWGPFEPCPRNPILTHAEQRQLPVQATGHADLVQDQEGAWWLVLLGIRPWDGAHHHLGRETFLAPVHWDAAGWPVVNQGRPIEPTLSVPALPGGAPRVALESYAASPVRDDFDAATLAPDWNFLRSPRPTTFALGARPGWLRLRANAWTLDDEGPVAFVGRRQLHYACRVRSALEFSPTAHGQRAGLVVRADENNHYDLMLTSTPRGLELQLQSRVQGESSTVARLEWSSPGVELMLETGASHYEFFAGDGAGVRHALGRLPSQPLASEVTGGFTGAYFGMFVSGGADTPPADFDYFEYTPLLTNAGLLTRAAPEGSA